MSTLNQERVAKRFKEVVENNLDISGEALLKSVGYGTGLQRSPSRVFKSKGFQEALKKLGFSLGAADLTVAKILRTGKEENKLKASDQIYKRLGGYQDSQEKGNKTLIINITGESANRYGINPTPITSEPENGGTGSPQV